MSLGAAHPRQAIGQGRRRALRSVLFVVDHDPNSLDVLLYNLSRRFGHDFTVRGDTRKSPAADAGFRRGTISLVSDLASAALASPS
jgi:hypothetical protein